MADPRQRELVQRDTFRPFSNFLGRFPSIWEDFENLGNYRFPDTGNLTLSEDKNNVYVEAGIPGFKPEDIEASVDQGILSIHAEKKEEDQNKDKEMKYYRKATSNYEYRIALPTQVDENKEPKTTYKDGVLKLVFPKKQQGKSKRINIKQG